MTKPYGCELRIAPSNVWQPDDAEPDTHPVPRLMFRRLNFDLAAK